jgi:uncharacterized membrane protein
VITQRAALAAALAGAAACLALAYLSSTGRLPPLLSVALSLVTPLVGAVVLTWRTRSRWLVLLAVVALAVAAAFHLDELARHVSALWFVQHAGVHALLAIVFGRTLLRGEVPLATRIARAVLPSMPPEVVRYSRSVTVAWTVYFIAMTALSVVLFFGASTAAWSAFATLVSGPLVAVMFALEFALRRRVLPASHCASIAETVAGFRRLMRAPAAQSTLPARQPHG